METHYDILIAGGGPAGTACALALRNKGYKVAILEKDHFPRDKVCGDAIPGLLYRYLSKTDPELVEQIISHPDKVKIQSTAVYADKGYIMSFHWKLLALNSKRVHFDQILFERVKSQTDTVIIEGERVQKIEPSESGVTVTTQNKTTFSTKILIACDGANSIIRRTAFPDFKIRNKAYSLRWYFKNVKGIDPSVNEVYMLKGTLPGYFWIFPVSEDEVNVGFGILDSHRKKGDKSEDMKVHLKDIISKHPLLAPRFKDAEANGGIQGFSLPIYDKKFPLSKDRIMLCGDAASLIDPIYGHGIDSAVISGMLAAKQAVASLEANDFSDTFLSQYDEELFQEIGIKKTKAARQMRTASLITPYIHNLFNLMAGTRRLFSKKSSSRQLH